MDKPMTKMILSLALTLPLLAGAQVDLKGLDRDMTGPRTQVLVLGTVHLSELPPGFDAAALKGVLDRLAAFRPDTITIEAVSGEECDLAARQPAKYGPDYCASTDAARAATGLDIPAALAEVDKMLKSWPAQPTPAQRRRLAALFLAANDRASALAQWLQLPTDARQPGDGLDAALVQLLGEVASRNNENYLVASRLAARLGLQRVYAVDNHTGDNVVDNRKAFGEALGAAWAQGRAVLDERERRVDRLAAAPDLLPLYRYVNDPDYLQVLADVNVKAALRARSSQGYPQIWVAGWETRNLRMVANVLEAFRDRPGARVLCIVGASHKPWFDAWLGQQQGVDVANVEAVLK